MSISFKQFAAESTIVYRGTPATSQASSVPTIWVSTSPEHAELYTRGAHSERGTVQAYKITGQLKTIDLGFRAAETSVPFDELASRLKERCMEQYEKGKLSEKRAAEIVDKINDMGYPGNKPVWEWLYNKDVVKVIKDMGYNAIKQREGMSAHKGDVVTYGILDSRLLKKV